MARISELQKQITATVRAHGYDKLTPDAAYDAAIQICTRNGMSRKEAEAFTDTNLGQLRRAMAADSNKPLARRWAHYETAMQEKKTAPDLAEMAKAMFYLGAIAALDIVVERRRSGRTELEYSETPRTKRAIRKWRP